jgi:arylsulfatase
MSEKRPPNILFLMTDQQRWDYVGYAGAKFLDTPHIDRIAQRGMRFSHCMTNSPVCVPARIGLATGLNPSRVSAAANATFLARRIPTYYQRLRDHGYIVGGVGKMDLAKPDLYLGLHGQRPCTYMAGFTHPVEIEGKWHSGCSPTPLGPYTLYLHEKGLLEAYFEDYKRRASQGYIKACGPSILPTEAFQDRYVGRRAAEWLEGASDDWPWHLFVSFAGPHNPFDPPAEYAKRYQDRKMPAATQDDLSGKPAWLRWRTEAATPDEIAFARRQYCGAITAIDDAIGDVMAALEKRGWLDNTIIIFSSDHGEMLGDHGMWEKQVAYEESIRVPLVVAGPGIPEGESDALIELSDINPTICELAGLPPQEEIDARSFVPLLRRETDAFRDNVLSWMPNFDCLRTRKYKLIANQNAEIELYDLEEDPKELRNIASERPEIVKELAPKIRERVLEGRWLR